MAAGFNSPLVLLGFSKGPQAGYQSVHPVFISKVATSDAGFLGIWPMMAGATAPASVVTASPMVKRIYNFGFAGRKV